jgi:hypothetical protein
MWAPRIAIGPDHTPQLLTTQAKSSHGWRVVCGSEEQGDIFGGDMAGSVEMQHTGNPASQRDVAAVIEHVLADRPGDWRVSIVGSQANDRWEMKIVGPNAFERSYTLEGVAGEHRPEAIRVILGKMLPK